MKTHIIAYIILGTALILSCMAQATVANAKANDPNPVDFGPKDILHIISKTGSHKFNVEIADTPEKQRHGYMFKQSVLDDEGMLFEFEHNRIQSIWMKNTHVSLDILFVRRNGRILKIVHGHKPYSLQSVTSGAPVPAVIELRAGRAKELGIEPGDLVKHEFFGTQKVEN